MDNYSTTLNLLAALSAAFISKLKTVKWWQHRKYKQVGNWYKAQIKSTFFNAKTYSVIKYLGEGVFALNNGTMVAITVNSDNATTVTIKTASNSKHGKLTLSATFWHNSGDIIITDYSQNTCVTIRLSDSLFNAKYGIVREILCKAATIKHLGT